MMHSYRLRAPGKINLALEIIGDRSDGFHELVMIMQSIALADQVEVRSNGLQEVRLFCNHPQVPLDASNLAHRAAVLMAENFPEVAANYGGVDITIEKQLPVAAGLAGGSGNGAAVLVGLNLLWQLGLTQPELQRLGAQLGSDVPFSIAGGTAIATGRGEQLDAIAGLHDLPLVLAKYENLGVSTPWAYQAYRSQFSGEYISEPAAIAQRTAQIHAGELVKAITHQDGPAIARLMHNDLEKVVLPAHPQVAQLKGAFQETEALGTMMSGSGPTVFGICESLAAADRVKQHLTEAIADPHLQVWTTTTLNGGIEIIP